MVKKTPLILPERDLRPYFKEKVEAAVENQQLDVTETSKFYIVNLLNDFTQTKQLFDWKEDHFEETPLAILLTEALHSDRGKQIKSFKRLGDICLHVSGFFADHIERKPVDIDYYISMGEGAYHNLSGILISEKVFCDLYGELASKFCGFVDVLAEVKNSSEVATNRDLIRLYEKWLKTGDPRLEEQLRKEGIDPQKIEPSSNNH